jgi:CTP:molybdopterin cytidylyltransferase MocA
MEAFPRMFSCIILSAGLSSRFGSPKALVRLDETPIIERLQRTVLSSGVDEIVVVLGDHRRDIKPHILNHKAIKIVYNRNYKYGQTSSFKKGISLISPKSQGVFLLPVDYPFISAKTLGIMMDFFQKHDFQMIIPVYQQQKGHPPLFSRNLLEEIRGWDNNQGLNGLALRIPNETLLLPIGDKGVILTFNTLEELKMIVTAQKVQRV